MKMRGRRALGIFLALVMVLTGIPTFFNANTAYAEDPDAPVFVFDEATGTIQGYTNKEGPADLVIPETINDVTVKHIADGAFMYNYDGSSNINAPIVSVTLPDTLETIGARAFINSRIEELAIPSSVNAIGHDAFRGNKNLTQVTFAEGSAVTELPNFCFYDAPLEHINLPEGLTTIGDEALYGCNLTTLEIPSTVTTIHSAAFRKSTIEHITLPPSVVSLGVETAGTPQGDRGIFFETYPDRNREHYRFATVTDYYGRATINNTYAIVNPTKVTFKYINAHNGNEIKEPVEAVGIEWQKIKIEGFWSEPIAGSGEFLTNYEIDYGDARTFFLQDHRDAILKGNYFYKGKYVNITTPDIEGYEPASATVSKTLKGGTDVLEFKYIPENLLQLNVEGEGVTTSPEAGELESGTEVDVKVLEPSNKKLTAFNVNGVDKLPEMATNGVAYTWQFDITEDTTLEPVYEDISYDKELEVTWNKKKLVLGDATTPTVKYRGEAIDSEAYDLKFDEAKAKMTDDGKFKPLVAGEVKATIVLKDKPALKKETKFNVAGVTVSMRMEDEYKTVLKPTDVVIDKLYLTEGEDYWKDYSFDKPVPALAIAKVAKEKGIATVTDSDDFELGNTMNWIVTLGQDKFDYSDDGNGSFMFDVNYEFVNLGIGEQPLTEGDIVRVYYQTDWQNNNPNLYFEEEEFEILEGESVDFKLNGYKLVPPDYTEERAPYAGAQLEINSETEDVDAVVTEEVTDEEGKISYTFDKAGTYHISARDPEAAVVRPYAHVVVKKPEKEKIYVHVSVNNVNAFYGLNLKAPKGLKVSDLTWKSWNKDLVTVNQKGRITGKKAGMTRVVGSLETEDKIVQYHYFVRVLPGRVSNLTGKVKGSYVYLSGNTPERIHGVRLYRAKKNSKGEYLYKYIRAYKYRGRTWKDKAYLPRGGRYGYAVKAYRVMPLYKRNAKGYYEKTASKTFWGYMSQRRVYAGRR